MSDNPRLDGLRRRVQADPASIAFAQLAEECRRAGDLEESVAVCRAGLAIHPGYVSARVTLGRALTELGRLEEAEQELSTVVASAPDNLAAVRGLAVVHRRRGDIEEALACYKDALELAPRDPDLERTIEDLTRQVEARRAEAAKRAAAASAPAPVRSTIAPALDGGSGEPAAEATSSGPPAPPGGTLRPSTDDRRARTLAALEQWLVAVHVARARPRT